MCIVWGGVHIPVPVCVVVSPSPVFLQSLSENLDLTRMTSQQATRMNPSQVSLPSLELQPRTAIPGSYMGARDPTQDPTDGQQALDWLSHPSLSAR